MMISAARKRINAIKQYSSLGAGFRIAMRDLEVRGAGSILGTAQSGHIMAVGVDLYFQLLKQAGGPIERGKTPAPAGGEPRAGFFPPEVTGFLEGRAGCAVSGLH